MITEQHVIQEIIDAVEADLHVVIAGPVGKGEALLQRVIGATGPWDRTSVHRAEWGKGCVRVVSSDWRALQGLRADLFVLVDLDALHRWRADQLSDEVWNSALKTDPHPPVVQRMCGRWYTSTMPI